MKQPSQLVIVLAATATTANADIRYRLEFLHNGEAITVPDPDTDSRIQTQNFKLWDNWSWIPRGGRTEIHGNTRIGGAEVGEVCYGVAGGAGQVAEVGFSHFNFSTTGTLTHYTETFRTYTLDGVLINSLSLRVGTFVPPGTGVTVAANILGMMGSVGDNFIFTLQYSDLEGIELEDMGTKYGAPISFGSSPAYSLNRTTGEQIHLPGGDHFLLMLHTDAVPAPGVCVAGLAMLPIALRRRR